MDEVIIPRDVLAVNLWVFRLTGAWIGDMSSPKLRFLYNIYGTLWMSVMTFAYFLTEVIHLMLIWGDLKAISEILLVLLTHLAHLVKLVNLLMRQKRIEKLLVDSSREEFLPRSISDRKLLKSLKTEWDFKNVLLNILCVLTIMGWAFIPLLENREERRLPLKTWFPFSINDTPIFEVIYVYQFFSLTLNACVNAMMDTFVTILMALTGIQIEILGKNLSDLSDEQSYIVKTLAVKNIERKSNVGKVEETEDKAKQKLLDAGIVAKEFADVQDDILHGRMVDCIEHHRAIVRFAREIQDVFGIGILAQFAVSSTIICLTCFELTLVSPSSLEFYTLLIYQSLMLCQIYYYCWYGNGIIFKTSELTTAAFHSQWISWSPRLKKTLRIIMCRMGQPTRLTVGGFFHLSVETFTMLLRTAYSIYAVLQRVRTEDN